MKALLLAPMGSVHRRFNKANISALVSLGYDVELCANFENGEGPESYNQKYVRECTEKRIVTHSIPFIRHSLMGNFRFLPQLKKLLCEGQYDVVHTHTETGGLLLKLAHGVKGESKFLYTPHGMSFWKGSGLISQIVYRPIERWICSCMDANLGMNMEEVENFKNWNPTNVYYVHGIGLNLARMQSPLRSRKEVRSEFSIAESDIMIVSVGELDNNKNHATVIKALARMKRRHFKYVICGEGPNRNMLLSLTASLGLIENVILAGYRSDIPDVLNAADAFVFPSYHEGMPVSVLEAMACGLPLVCSCIRGNVDIVKDGNNGYLFDPSDEVEVAEKLEMMMDNAENRFAMGSKNRKIVEHFSIESVIEELKKIYGSISYKNNLH